MSEPAGSAFQAQQVVDHYCFRPDYPADVYRQIVEWAPATGCLVDLGCGEGKIARPMARTFDRVVAVDPSANMLRLGQTLSNGDAANITWVEATAETAPLPDGIDVATFASSIHWMDPVPLIARLKPHLNTQHVMGIVQGDEPFEPPWQDAWLAFLSVWVPEMTGRPLGGKEWVGSRTRHLDHIEVVHGGDYISAPVTQSIEDFIQCQYSRDTFALSKLGSRRARFQEELATVLQPHADTEGRLTYRVKSSLTIGRLAG